MRAIRVFVWVVCGIVIAGCGGGGGGPTGPTYSIRGTLSDAPRVAGARVHLSGPADRVAVADSSGAFAFDHVAPGRWTLTPSEAGLTFEPVNRSVEVRGDVSGVDFDSSPFAANLVVDGATTYQRVAGVGVNVNVESWRNGELRPALDLLARGAGAGSGATLFRVVRDPMDWVADPDDIARLRVLDSSTLARVYETPAMRDLWSTIAHLNARGVTGERIILNFMGWTPPWMGGSGAFGIASRIFEGREQDFATQVASLVHYGRRVRGVDFRMLSPLNETDLSSCLESPCVSPDQYAVILAALVSELDRMGIADVRLIGPDTASPNAADAYIRGMMDDPAIAARTDHFALHLYGSAPAPRTSYPGKDYWLTETGASCGNCDFGGTPAQGEWGFASRSGKIVLEAFETGQSAVLVWDGYDSYYYHHGSVGYWGLLAYDTRSGRYTPRKRFHVHAQISGFVRPEMTRIALAGSPLGLGVTLAFSSADGKVVITGYNPGPAVTLEIRLDHLPLPTGFALHLTDEAAFDLEPRARVPVADGTCVVSLPQECFFTLSN